MAIGGKAFTQMVEGEKLFDIVLRLPPHLRDDPNVIAQIPVDVPGSRSGQARVSAFRSRRSPISSPHKPGASYIYRENTRRFIPIKFSVHNRDLASAIDEAQKNGLTTPRPVSSSPTRGMTSNGRASSPRCRRPTSA